MKHELTPAQRRLARWQNGTAAFLEDVKADIAHGKYRYPARPSRLLLQPIDEVQADYNEEREHGWSVR